MCIWMCHARDYLLVERLTEQYHCSLSLLLQQHIFPLGVGMNAAAIDNASAMQNVNKSASPGHAQKGDTIQTYNPLLSSVCLRSSAVLILGTTGKIKCWCCVLRNFISYVYLLSLSEIQKHVQWSFILNAFCIVYVLYCYTPPTPSPPLPHTHTPTWCCFLSMLMALVI